MENLTDLPRRRDVLLDGWEKCHLRLTHEPTGIVVESSTEIPEARFTKKRLRIAEEKLKAKLLDELEQKVARHPKAEDKAG